MTDLLPFPVLLPLFGAALTLVLRRHKTWQRAISLAVLLAQVVVAAILMVQTHRHGPQALWIGAWDEPLGIVLVADRLAALMLLVSSVVTLFVLLYAIGQGVSDGDEGAPLSIYFPTFLVLSAGVSNAFLAGDLFNLFVSFEMLLFASFVLLTLGGHGARIRAGTTYVIVSMVSSMLFLVAIAATYAATGTVNLAQLALRMPDIDHRAALALQLLLLIVFGIKAAVFPMSAWLPDSYPSAPAPVSAVFAGLLTKVGVYAILRVQTLLFGDSVVDRMIMIAGLVTMIIGILGAVAQSGIKRMLSFTLVSHIGFMLFGIGLMSQAGISAAVFYIAHHITVQTALFLVAGLIERLGGSTVLDRLGGLATTSPLLGVLFFVPAMNLAGIPPFSGFVAKTGLLQAGVADNTPVAWALVVGSIVTSILTLYAVTKAWSAAFWRPKPQEPAPVSSRQPVLGRLSDAVGRGVVAVWEDPSVELSEQRTQGGGMPRLMVLGAAAVILAGVVLAGFAGQLFAYTDSAAAQLLSPLSYISAVLPPEVR